MTKKISDNLISQSRLNKLFRITSVQYIFTAHDAPHRAIIVSNRSGNYQLYAVDFKSGYERQITHKKGGVLFGSISPDGKYVYVLNDRDGSEYGHFMRILFEGGEAINLTPDVVPYFSYSLSSDHANNTLCFTASIDGTNAVFVVTQQNSSFSTHKIYVSKNLLSEPICSSDGKFICVAESGEKRNKNVLLLLTTDKDRQILRSHSFETIIPLAFSKTAQSPIVLALSRTNSWLRPILYDFETKNIFKIQHKKFSGDVWVLSWIEDRNEMVVCDVYQAKQMLYIYNTNTKKLRRIGPRTGSFNFHFNSLVRLSDGSFIVQWHDFNTSPRLIRLHSPHYDTWSEISKWSGKFRSQYQIKSIRVHSTDGERVQAWIVQPHRVNKRLPFVIDVHGGPHGVSGNEFSPEAQAWLEAGFGYCTVNYRGSISFGKNFERKIYGNPGHWEVEDVAAVRNWLVRNNYTDANHIILYGWSWGGYVTLLALGKYPALWRCGIAGAAITDCVMQYEDEPAYFKAQDKERFNGTPQTARARYICSSPISYANRIQSPILLLHGKNDVRCPPRQIQHFISKLKKLCKDISIIWFPSGHIGDFTNILLRTQLMRKILNFAITCKKMPLKNKIVS
jgi:dipeptidyl aminopeptidase/acylaminoacyl peptidase